MLQDSRMRKFYKYISLGKTLDTRKKAYYDSKNNNVVVALSYAHCYSSRLFFVLSVTAWHWPLHQNSAQKRIHNEVFGVSGMSVATNSAKP